jgi:hypothetical protein
MSGSLSRVSSNLSFLVVFVHRCTWTMMIGAAAGSLWKHISNFGFALETRILESKGFRKFGSNRRLSGSLLCIRQMLSKEGGSAAATVGRPWNHLSTVGSAIQEKRSTLSCIHSEHALFCVFPDVHRIRGVDLMLPFSRS